MSAILEIHREYALVDRMKDLLKDPPKTNFSETLSYALFSSIIPWVCQRSRSPEYNFIYQKLLSTELPKSIKSYFRMLDGYEIPNAGEALVDIRNAISHADARRVIPINDNNRLHGFKWLLFRKIGNENINIGKLSMRTLAIQRTGIFFADTYCSIIRERQLEESDEQFYDAVSMSLREVA
jgi:hypothetical protein